MKDILARFNNSPLLAPYAGRLDPFAEHIVTHAQRIEADPLYVASIILVESGGIHTAFNERSKATGLMQVLPREAIGIYGDKAWLRARPTIAQLRDPETNIRWGCNVLADSLRQAGGDLKEALRRYSGKPANYETVYWAKVEEFRKAMAGLNAPEKEVAMAVVKLMIPQSKHHSDRQGRPVQALILHTTESPIDSGPEATLRYLIQNERLVSIHDYLAPWSDGSIHLHNMVPYTYAAHHAGAASARLPNGASGGEVNLRTVGLEIYRRVDQRLSDALIEAAIEWAVDKCRLFRLRADDVLSHAQVDPSRRSDPVGIDMGWFRAEVRKRLNPVPVPAPAPVPPRVGDIRWSAEQAAREIEAGEVELALGRLLADVIPPLYRLEGSK